MYPFLHYCFFLQKMNLDRIGEEMEHFVNNYVNVCYVVIFHYSNP